MDLQITELTPSKRSNIASFLAMDMLRAANDAETGGQDIVHMEVGQPGARPPEIVLEAARAGLASDRIGYTEALGMPVLRERISRHYRETYGVAVDPSRVVVTTGSSAGFILSFLSICDAGDRFVLTTPGYPAYRNILASLDIEPVLIETSAANRWSPTQQDIEGISSGAPVKGILLASPANPTGTMLSPDTLKSILETCRQAGMWFVSDEIYHGLTYTMPAACALQFDENAIVINSFSKYYCMTGWRIGWMIVPQNLVRRIECLAQNLFISPPTLSQIAALAAFDATEELEVLKAQYATNRDILLNELPASGLTELAPADGAFYVYADIHRFSNDSLDFAHRLLNETGVAITPGADFDSARGHQFVRLSFAGSQADVREACIRLKRFLA